MGIEVVVFGQISGQIEGTAFRFCSQEIPNLSACEPRAASSCMPGPVRCRGGSLPLAPRLDRGLNDERERFEGKTSADSLDSRAVGCSAIISATSLTT